MSTGFTIDDRLGTFEGVAALAPEHAPTLQAVRTAVAELHPGATELASVREKSVWWGWGGGKMTHGYAYVVPHKAHVNLGFFRGTSLPDPENLLEGTGKALRHVKIRTPDDIDRPAIRALLAAARDERRAALKTA